MIPSNVCVTRVVSRQQRAARRSADGFSRVSIREHNAALEQGVNVRCCNDWSTLVVAWHDGRLTIAHVVTANANIALLARHGGHCLARTS
jgi:hypothetical protein